MLFKAYVNEDSHPRITTAHSEPLKRSSISTIQSVTLVDFMSF